MNSERMGTDSILISVTESDTRACNEVLMKHFGYKLHSDHMKQVLLSDLKLLLEVPHITDTYARDFLHECVLKHIGVTLDEPFDKRSPEYVEYAKQFVLAMKHEAVAEHIYHEELKNVENHQG